jgi:hypothetical protein
MISLLSTYRFFLVLVLSVSLTIGAGWFLASNQASQSLDVKRPASWKMPDWKPQSISADIQILKDKEFFGAKKQIEETPEEPEPIVVVNQDWRGIGIILDGRESKILIKNNLTKEVQALKVGEKLPDGRVVDKIEKDSFTISSDKGSEEIRLFPFEAKDTNVPEDVPMNRNLLNANPLEDKNEN